MAIAEPKPRSRLDRLFYALVTRGWTGPMLTNYAEQLHRHNAMLSPDALHAFELIDTKATGLLTHVSLMIAGLGLVAPLVASNDIEVGIVIFEIGVYLLIAIGCLRCLSVFHARDFLDQPDLMQDMVHCELIIRRELYSLCIRASIAFTIVVFLLLPTLYFWKPNR